MCVVALVCLGRHTVHHPKFAAAGARSRPSDKRCTQDTVLPTIEGFFEFDPEKAYLMHERVYTHVLIMLGQATNHIFKRKISEFAKEFGLSGHNIQCPEPKAFGRALNKVDSDYCDLPSPKGGYNVDIIRCLLVPKTAKVAELLTLYQGLVTHFSKDGIAKVKNMFALPADERELRFHLLCLMVTVVFETGVTFKDLGAQDDVAATWDTYCARCPDASETHERWVRHTAMARKYLAHPDIADKQVVVLGEIQLLPSAMCRVRHRMHEPYKVWRAESPKHLFDDFQRTSTVRSELDTRADEDQTTLVMAAYLGQLTVVKMMLGRGEDVNFVGGAEGSTPLYYAAQRGNNVDVVHELIKHGADLDASDKNKRSALFFAAQFGFRDVVVLLVDSGAEVNKKDTNSGTPLTIAARFGHLAIIKYLVEHGGDITVASRHGTALAQAREFKRASVVAYLEGKGATE